MKNYELRAGNKFITGSIEHQLDGENGFRIIMRLEGYELPVEEILCDGVAVLKTTHELEQRLLNCMIDKVTMNYDRSWEVIKDELDKQGFV